MTPKKRPNPGKSVPPPLPQEARASRHVPVPSNLGRTRPPHGSSRPGPPPLEPLHRGNTSLNAEGIGWWWLPIALGSASALVLVTVVAVFATQALMRTDRRPLLAGIDPPQAANAEVKTKRKKPAAPSATSPVNGRALPPPPSTSPQASSAAMPPGNSSILNNNNSGTQPSPNANPPAPAAPYPLLLSDRDALERRARGALLKPTHGKTLGDFATQLAVYDIELYLSILGEKVTEEEYLALVRRVVRETFQAGGPFENMSIAEDLTQMSDLQKQFDDTFAKYQKEAGEIRSYQVNGILPAEIRDATLDYDLFFKCTPRFVQKELKKLRQNGPTPEFDLDSLFAQAANAQTKPAAAGAAPNYQIGDKVASRHRLGLRVWSGRIVGIANGVYTVRIDYASNPARHSGVMPFSELEIQPHQGVSILEGIDGLKSLLGN